MINFLIIVIKILNFHLGLPRNRRIGRVNMLGLSMSILFHIMIISSMGHRDRLAIFHKSMGTVHIPIILAVGNLGHLRVTIWKAKRVLLREGHREGRREEYNNRMIYWM